METMWISPKTNFDTFELDEIWWFLNNKEKTETQENIYIMTMLSREPRQIVGFRVDTSVKSQKIQEIVDSISPAKNYCTDGGKSYLNVIFEGKHIRVVKNKSETHNIESSNADLRHYIKGLARRSRCFFRKKETLELVLQIFINAYNKFGEAKMKMQRLATHRTESKQKHLHKYCEVDFSVLDFL